MLQPVPQHVLQQLAVCVELQALTEGVHPPSPPLPPLFSFSLLHCMQAEQGRYADLHARYTALAARLAAPTAAHLELTAPGAKSNGLALPPPPPLPALPAPPAPAAAASASDRAGVRPPEPAAPPPALPAPAAPDNARAEPAAAAEPAPAPAGPPVVLTAADITHLPAEVSTWGEVGTACRRALMQLAAAGGCCFRCLS